MKSILVVALLLLVGCTHTQKPVNVMEKPCIDRCAKSYNLGTPYQQKQKVLRCKKRCQYNKIP
ncbi:MAG: hypothetical protein U9N11_03640 [Campylobacterota bacterium]|nr:hypothetical protein [Campylobacterota bacterium]